MLLSVGGESESYFQAPASSVFSADLAIVQFHHSRGDSEPNALSAALMISAFVRTKQRLKNT